MGKLTLISLFLSPTHSLSIPFSFTDITWYNLCVTTHTLK